MRDLRRDLNDLATSAEVPPPPDLATLGGRPEADRRSSWPPLAVAAAVALVLIASTVVGVALVRDREPSPAAPTASWSSTDVPYLEYDGGDVILRFGSGKLTLTTDNEDPDFRRLQAVAATANSAFASLADPRGATSMTEVASSGEVRAVSDEVVGIAIADPGGDLAAWAEPGAENTLRVVAFDAAKGTTVSSLEVPADSVVVAVDGRQVYVAGSAGTRVWSVDGRPVLTPLPDAIPSDKLVMDASATGGYLGLADTGTVLYDPEGKVVHDFKTDLFGTFDPTGMFAAFSGLPDPDGTQPYVVFDIRAGDEVQLKLPDGVAPIRFRWTPDGDLVVESFTENGSDEVATSFTCALPEGSCSLLGEMPGELAPQFESSARGQLAATSPAD